MHRTARIALVAASAALLAGGLSAGIAAPPLDAAGTGNDWPGVGGGSDETQFSRLTQVTAANVGKLGLAWSLDLPDEVSLEATPIEVGGVVYFSGSYAKVYAVDAVTGKLLWSYDPETWKVNPTAMHFSFGANRGVAYENGKVFVAGIDGRLHALDAKTGKALWIADSIPKGAFNASTGAPRVMNGKVIIGNGGADFGARGFVTAFDAGTGKLLWRFYTTPSTAEANKGDAAMEAAAKTWSAEFIAHAGTPFTGGGGTAWNGMTYDPELDRVYIGVGNAGGYDPELRDPKGGDDLYTSSIVALDAKTGKYIWHYQETPRDSWDYKATPNISLATLTIGGKPRKVLLHAPTNGFFYALDRDTGKLLNQPGITTEVNWATSIDMKTGRPVERPGIRYQTGDVKMWPGTVGGHNWQPMSYNPSLGLAYIPTQQIGTLFSKGGAGGEVSFNVMGLTISPIVEKPGDGHGTIVAWDPVAQKERWRVTNKNLWNGGTLATAGGLVFQGTAEGTFNAYDGATGKPLWSFDAGLGIIGAPASYSVGGKQYVSILVGYGGTTAAYGKYMDVGWKYGAQTRRLLTFAIGGKAKLAKMPGPDFVVHALDDPALKLDEADVAAGRTLSVQCAACHGAGMHATGTPAPDLRESGLALDLVSLRDLLKSGALMSRGMPRFEYLTDDQTRQLHAYIRAKARESLGLRKVEAQGPMPRL
jgi:quinohemoprotein ethanol dehydrogenase